MEKGANKLPEWKVHSGYTEGEATGVGRGLCPILAKPLGLGRELSVCLTGMYIRDMRSISLGRELGAIAQSDSRRGWKGVEPPPWNQYVRMPERMMKAPANQDQ